MHRYNTYVQEKQKLKQKRKQRINKAAGKISGGLEGLGGAVDSGIGLYQSIEAGDGIGVASSVLGMVAVGAAFFPPVGTAIAALAGIASSIIGLFGGGQSDVDIIGGLIEKQTEQIASMLEDQTTILLKALSQLSEEQRKLAKITVRQILVDNYQQMIDDMQGKLIICSMKIVYFFPVIMNRH